ncbi:MAG TPA: ECF-type sigma factor [Pirellulaceae bacterium]|nr:ECF-type sigma factor [Pirellulaceae bacterium]HMO91245.1 ECF-type sigma factor [Pirellulaceae bacterium]HMP68571.1 ECF-type sigma factor [Pirellulaceae bacterium]
MTPNQSRRRLDELLPLVYDQMRAYASRALETERANLSVQTTDLVHEVYLRLSQLREIDWENEQEILRTAVAVMRRVLVDRGRHRRRQKRQPTGVRVQLDGLGDGKSDSDSGVDVLDLHEALERLAAFDERKAEIVSLRCFGGLTVEQVSEALCVSTTTVKREWAVARAWLFRELKHEPTVE